MLLRCPPRTPDSALQGHEFTLVEREATERWAEADLQNTQHPSQNAAIAAFNYVAANHPKGEPAAPYP